MNYTEKNNLLDKISVIGLMAILVEVFLYAVDSAYTAVISNWLTKVPLILNIIGVVFLGVAITLFIFAYKKSNSSKVIYAIEFLALAFLCPFLNHWYNMPGEPLKSINPRVLWIIVLVYYVIRVIYTCVKAYMNSSDMQMKKKRKK